MPRPDRGVLRRQLRQPPRPPLGGAGRSSDACVPRRPARSTSPRPARPTRCGCCCRACSRPARGSTCPAPRPRWKRLAAMPQARRCDLDLVAELLRARMAETGAQAGVDHAESFRRLQLRLSSALPGAVARRRRSGGVLDGAPLAHGPQGQHGHHGHAGRAHDRADQAGQAGHDAASPSHWRSTRAQPMRPPHSPPTRIETKASTRAPARAGRWGRNRRGLGPFLPALGHPQRGHPAVRRPHQVGRGDGEHVAGSALPRPTPRRSAAGPRRRRWPAAAVPGKGGRPPRSG